MNPTDGGAPLSRLALAVTLASVLSTGVGLADPEPQRESTVSSASDREEATTVTARLHRIFDDYFEELLRRDAVFASEIGDPRYNDRLENFLSEGYRAEERAFRERWLAAVRTIDRAALGGQDRRSYDVFVGEQQRALDELRFPRHLLPVSQLFGVPALFAQLGSGDGDHPFRTEKDYRDFLARIDAWVVVADQIVANLREGIRRGVVQPKALMTRALPQLERQLVDDPEESVFYRPLRELPPGIDAAGAERLRSAYRKAIVEKIVPSYRKIRDVVRDEYLPACRDSIGMSALPDGAAWYAERIRAQTSTALEPQEIHRIGLTEVSRIEGEMRAVLRELGFEGDLAAFRDSLRRDPRFRVASGDDLLGIYRGLYEKVRAALPALFGGEIVQASTAALAIEPVPEIYAADAPAAIYNAGAADGSRPGTLFVNTHDLPSRPTYESDALFLHEALPGHHLQAVVARGAGALPRFRRFVQVNAYSEGWGLYSESLGRELGLYADPYSRFGRLDNEMLRAVRLVVDTGIHAEGWSRERAMELLASKTSLGASEVATEVDRYIAWPAQALGYKLGELTIQRLRQRAETKLGPRFDPRAFHRAVLEDGALPLDVLERKIDEWLQDQAPPATVP